MLSLANLVASVEQAGSQLVLNQEEIPEGLLLLRFACLILCSERVNTDAPFAT